MNKRMNEQNSSRKNLTYKSTSLQKYIYSLFTVHQKSKTIRFKKKVLMFRVNNDTETR